MQEEWLDRIIPMGERHLRRAIAEYIDRFHAGRNHEGLRNLIPVPDGAPAEPVRRHRARAHGSAERYYHREAA
jgi:hypothetical protein